MCCHIVFLPVAAATADMGETTRLATTVDAWWPAVIVALTEEVTDAGTNEFNRIIKQTKRVGCGLTNMTTAEGASWSTSPSLEGRDQ